MEPLSMDALPAGTTVYWIGEEWREEDIDGRPIVLRFGDEGIVRNDHPEYDIVVDFPRFWTFCPERDQLSLQRPPAEPVSGSAPPA